MLPIEPKWNWNHVDNLFALTHLPSNRTKVELKQLPVCLNESPADASNRTKVELKLIVIFWIPVFVITSNRTKVELKHAHNHHCNVCTLFQSNQSGIETVNIRSYFFSVLSSNRTKVELKQKICRNYNSKRVLPIEPKWNWNIKLSLPFHPGLLTSNRTKVELKRRLSSRCPRLQRLPIEPKWNWNRRVCFLCADNFTSNRTKVELKP